MKNIRRHYGWKPDVPDARDLRYGAIRPALRFPKAVDLRGQCSAVEAQGNLGSCTAQALAGHLEFLDKKIDGAYTEVSRLFIYYNERVLERSVDSDSGASLRDGIKTLAKTGACAETLWPYAVAKFAERPPARCYAEAAGHTVKSYQRLAGLRVGSLERYVLPPFASVAAAAAAFAPGPVAIGAQNMHAEDAGAWTGEVSAPMLVEAGCRYVELAHSERLAHFDVTYGPLGAIATVMLWLWVSSYAVLLGAELNAVLEKEAVLF